MMEYESSEDYQGYSIDVDNYSYDDRGDQIETAYPQTARSNESETENESPRSSVPLSLTIDSNLESKPFLGGYFSRKTQLEYHHAATNTDEALEGSTRSRPTNKLGENVAVQTIIEANKEVQTRRDTYTQSTRPDYYSSEKCQRVLFSRPYFDSDQWEARRIQAVIVLQKYWRRVLATKQRQEMLQTALRRIEWTEKVREKKNEARLALRKEESDRQGNPTRMADIEFLYRAINEWKNEQIKYIEAHRWGPERKAALALISEQETNLLLDLERTKANIKSNMRDSNINMIFKKMGQPSKWISSSGTLVTVDNQEKSQVRCLHQLYLALKKPVEDFEERKEILEQVYETIRGYDGYLTDLLIDLMKREIVFMDRCMSKDLLSGLRLRIQNGFVALCRDVKFNPQAQILAKIPFESRKLRKEMLQCSACRRILHRSQFAIEKGIKLSKKCLRCSRIYTSTVLREDLNLYTGFLNALRIEEQIAGVQNSFALSIDASDIKFIVETIWHGQSAISGNNDRYMLRLCRWRKNHPWTPWNSILLTQEESTSHLRLDNLKAYQESFVDKIVIKHNSARIYFEKSSKSTLN